MYYIYIYIYILLSLCLLLLFVMSVVSCEPKAGSTPFGAWHLKNKLPYLPHHATEETHELLSNQNMEIRVKMGSNNNGLLSCCAYMMMLHVLVWVSIQHTSTCMQIYCTCVYMYMYCIVWVLYDPHIQYICKCTYANVQFELIVWTGLCLYHENDWPNKRQLKPAPFSHR